MRTLLAALALVPCLAHADSGLPFMRDMVGDRELPLPFGVGFDIFTLDQGYDIDALSFTLPGVSLSDPSVIDVRNEVQHADLKFDVWLLPFLNVFAIYGHIEGDTLVDLSRVPAQLPIPLGALPVEYSGQVYGGGATLAYGGERWFASLTGTYADTDLSGDFDSSVESLTWQPKVGVLWKEWAFWVGGLYLDADERHRGVFQFPGLGAIPFDVSLTESDAFNYTIGARYAFGRYAEATLELGGGDRDTTLFNFAWRFE
jgi:hypothetical protein